jgi:exosortase H (IPTLxxWG-CTERM-specific)
MGRRKRNTAAARPTEAAAAAAATRWGQLKFFVVFALVAGLGSLVYCYPYAPDGVIGRWLSAYLHAYASMAGAVISLFDATARVSGQDIIGRFSLHVSKDCDAMEANIVLVAAVVAFPASWRSRAVGLLAGMTAVSFSNVVRLTSLYFVGIHSAAAFEFGHLELWPLLMIAISLGVFVAWTSWTKGRLVTADAGG